MKKGVLVFSVAHSRINFSAWMTDERPPFEISFLPEPLNVANELYP